MARKKHRHESKLSTDQLAEQAQEHLAGNHFKDAIHAFKLLLKKDPQAQWREELARAYHGRAQQLAAKAMYQEAAVLWQNMEALGEAADPAVPNRDTGEYLDWLIAAGQTETALRVYQSRASSMDTRTAQTLGSRLAAVLISHEPAVAEKLVNTLPPEQPLARHMPAAQAALQAFCTGDDEAMEQHLREIPFRSPYRDLGQILKAVSRTATAPSDAADAHAQLSRTPPHSGFAALARLALAATAATISLIDILPELDAQGVAFVAAIKGLDEHTLTAARDLCRNLAGQSGQHADTQSAKALLAYILSTPGALNKDEAAHIAKALLPTHPAGLAHVETRFGRLSQPERLRLKALVAESQDQHPLTIEDHWLNYVNALESLGDGPDTRLKAALVLRHVVAFRKKVGGAEAMDEDAIDFLERSLKLDPDDPEAYLELLHIIRSRPVQRSRYHRWAYAGAQRFPENRDLVTDATISAMERQAFKKAAGMARKLLNHDPLNTDARRRLIAAHLSHARRLLAGHRFEAAQKELQVAADAEKAATSTGAVSLLRGITWVLADQPDKGLPLIQQGLQEAGGPLPGELAMRLEIRRLLLPQKQETMLLQVVERTETTSLQEVRRFVAAVKALGPELEGQALDWRVQEAIHALAKDLRKLVKLPYTEEDMAALCACFQSADHFELLKQYATHALTCWPQQPVFVYFQIVARTKNTPRKLSRRDETHLIKALDHARDRGERKTEQVIDAFLNRALPPMHVAGDALPTAPPWFKQAMEQLMEEMEPEQFMEMLDDLEARGELPSFPTSGPSPAKPRQRRKSGAKSRPKSGGGHKQGGLF